jgi:hypothetical protein
MGNQLLTLYASEIMDKTVKYNHLSFVLVAMVSYPK